MHHHTWLISFVESSLITVSLLETRFVSLDLAQPLNVRFSQYMISVCCVQ